jgi:hypothetical protein
VATGLTAASVIINSVMPLFTIPIRGAPVAEGSRGRCGSGSPSWRRDRPADRIRSTARRDRRRRRTRSELVPAAVTSRDPRSPDRLRRQRDHASHARLASGAPLGSVGKWFSTTALLTALAAVGAHAGPRPARGPGAPSGWRRSRRGWFVEAG